MSEFGREIRVVEVRGESGISTAVGLIERVFRAGQCCGARPLVTLFGPSVCLQNSCLGNERTNPSTWEDGRLPEESIVTITLSEADRGRTELILRQVGWTYGALEWGLHATRAGLAEEIDKLSRHLETAAVQAI